MEINAGKFGKFEITTVLDANGENKPNENQIAELHAVPHIIIIRHYKQDGVDVFVAKSITGVIFIKTINKGLIKELSDAWRDNIAINLLEVARNVEDNGPDTTGLLIDKLNFGMILKPKQLADLQVRPSAKILGVARFETYKGMFANSFELETSIGKYAVILTDEAIATKMATAYVTGQSVDLFEKLEG